VISNYPQDRQEFFKKLRSELTATSSKRTDEGRFPSAFEELIDRFEKTIKELASKENATKGEIENACEYLREIVFMDGCLEAVQRRNLGTRLLATYLLATRRASDRISQEIRAIFQIAPAADYFLAYALAWQVGWFDKDDDFVENKKKADNKEDGNRLKIISLHSIKGGTGKSFLAQLYALACARENLRTVVVDLDFTGPTLQFLGSPKLATEHPLKGFPIFFKDDLPQFDVRLQDLVDPVDPLDTAADLGLKLNASLEEKVFERRNYLTFDVDPIDEEKGAEEDWESLFHDCLRPSALPFKYSDLVSYMVLPHRPEFLRRAGHLLESPDYPEWLVIKRWLGWLFGRLQRDFDVVVLDNAPGISNTWIIMQLVWDFDGCLSTSDRSVCVVSSPRMPDLGNAAYELLWIQAEDWRRSAEGEVQRKVYWIGNMWHDGAGGLESMIESGEFLFLASHNSGAPKRVHEAPRAAYFLAGLVESDIERIREVLHEAKAAGRLVLSEVHYNENFRRFFDFDLLCTHMPRQDELDGVLDKLLESPPLAMLVPKEKKCHGN
jgi:hypothetical protein